MKVILIIMFSSVSFFSMAHVESHEVSSQSVVSKNNKSELVTEIKQLITQAKKERDESLYKKIISKIELDEVTDSVLFLYKADAQQYLHKFDEALFTLSLATELSGAKLMKANILLTQGRYKEAAEECKQLIGKLDEVFAITCYSHAISLNGQLEKGHQLLSRFVTVLEKRKFSNLQWPYAVLGEMSERRSDYDKAELFYNKALKIDSNDVASRMALADIFIEQKRYDDALKLTSDFLKFDSVLLRYVRALNIQGDLTTNGYFCELKRRVLRYKNKQEHLHYDTKSEYQLYFTPDIDTALSDIQQHWSQQKLPRDARLISRISFIKGEIDVLDELREWQLANHLEDQSLSEILN